MKLLLFSLFLVRPSTQGEFQVLNLKKKDFHIKLVNLYSPNDKALSLNALPALLINNRFLKFLQRYGNLDRIVLYEL